MTTLGIRARDLLITGVVSIASFGYFIGASRIVASLRDEYPSPSASAIAIRLGAAIVIAAAMLAIERRRVNPSIEAAVSDGAVVAVLIVVVGSLVESEFSGAALAVRTVTLLVGLPVLEVLTHLLARRLT